MARHFAWLAVTESVVPPWAELKLLLRPDQSEAMHGVRASAPALPQLVELAWLTVVALTSSAKDSNLAWKPERRPSSCLDLPGQRSQCQRHPARHMRSHLLQVLPKTVAPQLWMAHWTSPFFSSFGSLFGDNLHLPRGPSKPRQVASRVLPCPDSAPECPDYSHSPPSQPLVPEKARGCLTSLLPAPVPRNPSHLDLASELPCQEPGRWEQCLARWHCSQAGAVA
mmetsp:Transcript_37438/g.67677  ORF Transcript_37438/g.67677 Transcript_37438/m.67677 type:complete len:225 (-) Transcript_37438:1252-1926(-)